jgi:hypothetical protein
MVVFGMGMAVTYLKSLRRGLNFGWGKFKVIEIETIATKKNFERQDGEF